jgi:hypothetical protein
MSKSKMVDPWHYARPQLARQYLQTFEIGLIAARGLFAPRRMGKSEFLEQDLIPAAAAKGYHTAYVNLWDARETPYQALTSALARTLEPSGLAALARRFKRSLRKVKASAKMGRIEGSLEAELAHDPRLAEPLMSEVLREFDGPGKRLLLVLDEAQVLAASAHTELAHALRAALDTRKANIKVVFAGSSEGALRRMFARPTEPFYNWAPIEPFELLGGEFVRALVGRVNRLSRFSLDPAEALGAFETLKRTPEFFRRYLNRYLNHADLGSRAALEATRAQVFSSAAFDELWGRLLPTDRIVLKLLADGVTDLHSHSTRGRLGRALGRAKPVGLNTPAQALRRLQRAELVVRLEPGRYQVLDEALLEWVRQLDFGQ